MSLVLNFQLLVMRRASEKIACLFVRPKVSDWAHVTWTWHKRSHAKSKLIRNEPITIKLSQWQAPISNVEVKNIKLAWCASFKENAKEIP